MRKSTHQYTVSGKLTHVTGAQFPHLSSNAVLFHQWLLKKIHADNYIKAFCSENAKLNLKI